MFTVIKETANSDNMLNLLTTQSLFQKYNFVHKRHLEGDRLIHIEEVRYFLNDEYYRINKHVGDLILSIAEYGEHSDSLFNFNIYADGRIELGCQMNQIKKNIETYKKRWHEHNKNRKYCKITIKSKGE